MEQAAYASQMLSRWGYGHDFVWQAPLSVVWHLMEKMSEIEKKKSKEQRMAESQAQALGGLM